MRHFRWSSLAGIVAGDGKVQDRGWQAGGRFGASLDARKAYEHYLIGIGRDETRWAELGLHELSRGWAIGSAAWRQSLAKEYNHLALQPGLEAADVRELRERAWEASVQKALAERNRTDADLITKPRKQPWKLAVAAQSRADSGASFSWLAQRLHFGAPASLRGYLCRHKAF